MLGIRDSSTCELHKLPLETLTPEATPYLLAVGYRCIIIFTQYEPLPTKYLRVKFTQKA